MIESAKMSMFVKAAIDDQVTAVEDLRADLEAAHGPFVEPVDDSRVLVTFVWIGAEGRVSVRSPLLGIESSIPMTRVHGTDVSYLSVPVRADVTTTYEYRIDDPLLEYDARSTPQHELLRLRREVAPRTYTDPFNPDRLPPATPAAPWSTVLTLPQAEAMPWFEAPAETQGSLERHQFVSATLGNERTVTVYLPPCYQVDSTPYSLVVMLDGEMWLRPGAEQHIALDNLIAADRIPPVVVAFIDNPPSELPFSTTRAFEMTCNPDFPSMLADELLPMLHARYRVAADPRCVVIAGPSFGGLAAAYAGFERPEVFGNVLACSPAVWWGCATDEERFSVDEYGQPVWLAGQAEEPEWLTRRYAATERKPLRFWVDVGCLEIAPMMPTPVPGLDYRTAVRHFRTVLLAKGYDVTYYEAPGGHDWPTFRRSYVKGLETLLATAGNTT